MVDNNKLWNDRNQLNDDNVDYIENVLCVPYKITVKLIADGADDILLLSYKLDTYKVEIDKEKCCLHLYKRNKVGNPKSKEFYHYIKEFSDMDCWCDLIFFIVRKGNNNVEAS